MTTMDSNPSNSNNAQAQSTDWALVREFYLTCRSYKQTAEHFGLTIAQIKNRAIRGNWKNDTSADTPEVSETAERDTPEVSNTAQRDTCDTSVDTSNCMGDTSADTSAAASTCLLTFAMSQFLIAE